MLDGSSCTPRRGTWRWERVSEGMETETAVGSVVQAGDDTRRRLRRPGSLLG